MPFGEQLVDQSVVEVEALRVRRAGRPAGRRAARRSRSGRPSRPAPSSAARLPCSGDSDRRRRRRCRRSRSCRACGRRCPRSTARGRLRRRRPRPGRTRSRCPRGSRRERALGDWFDSSDAGDWLGGAAASVLAGVSAEERAATRRSWRMCGVRCRGPCVALRVQVLLAHVRARFRPIRDEGESGEPFLQRRFVDLRTDDIHHAQCRADADPIHPHKGVVVARAKCYHRTYRTRRTGRVNSKVGMSSCIWGKECDSPIRCESQAVQDLEGLEPLTSPPSLALAPIPPNGAR